MHADDRWLGGRDLNAHSGLKYASFFHKNCVVGTLYPLTKIDKVKHNDWKLRGHLKRLQQATIVLFSGKNETSSIFKTVKFNQHIMDVTGDKLVGHIWP